MCIGFLGLDLLPIRHLLQRLRIMGALSRSIVLVLPLLLLLLLLPQLNLREELELLTDTTLALIVVVILVLLQVRVLEAELIFADGFSIQPRSSLLFLLFN